MKKHVRIYIKYFGYGEQDIILCENCGKIAVDVHHIISKGRGGKDVIGNLIGLCRECHDRAHLKLEPYLRPEELKPIHLLFMKSNKK